MRVIGAADEFWRLRLTRVDATSAPDFEWRDDVLYRDAPSQEVAEAEVWNVEAVATEDYETIVCIASYDSAADARTFMERVSADLTEMTKHQFEEAYLSAPSDGDFAANLGNSG